MQSTAPKPHASRLPCSVCGGPMTVHDEVRGGVCSKSSCRSAAVRSAISQREAAAAELLKQQIMNARQTLIPTLWLREPDSVAVAIVPAGDRSVVALPAKRRVRFRRYLSGIVAEALRQAAEPQCALPDDESPTAPQFDEEAPALQAACGTCRGHCCRLGGPNNAFLDVATLRRVIALRPELRRRQLVREYMRRIAPESFQDSCVFHGASGCTLPRQMRARICNEYHCEGLQRLSSLYEAPRNRRILIVASSDSEAVRWRMLDRDSDDPGRASVVEERANPTGV